MAGFIAADGTIRSKRNEIKIGLSTKDREILEKIKEFLKVERQINDYISTNNFDISELAFSSKKIKDDLKNLGISSNKTYKKLSMQRIPDTFKLNFIHGYFDGDGSLTLLKNFSVSTKIVSYDDNILIEISDYLLDNFNIKTTGIYKDVRRESLYSLELSTKSSLELCKLFYESEHSSSIYLERKFNKYLSIKNKRI